MMRNPCSYPKCLNLEWNVVPLDNNATLGAWEVWSINTVRNCQLALWWWTYSRWDQSAYRLVSHTVMMMNCLSTLSEKSSTQSMSLRIPLSSGHYTSTHQIYYIIGILCAISYKQPWVFQFCIRCSHNLPWTEALVSPWPWPCQALGLKQPKK